MPVNPVPDPDHVVRQVPARLVIRENGVPVACFPEAFQLRPATEKHEAETYLSATWLEFFQQPRANQLSEVRKEVRGYRELKRKDVFAVCNVGNIRGLGKDRDRKLRVMHEPTDVARAYAAIRGIRQDDAEISGLLVAEAIAELAAVASIE